MIGYQQYVLLIIGLVILIISVFNIVTVALNMTSAYKEEFDIYSDRYGITDAVNVLIEQNRYNRPLLNNQDNSVFQYENRLISGEQEEFGRQDIDCVSHWNEVSECDAKCYGNTSGIAEGEQIYSLSITTPSQRDGTPCPTPTTKTDKCSKKCDVDCVVDTEPYAGSNSCNAMDHCDGNSKNAKGTKTLKYKIKLKPKNNGKKCEEVRTDLRCGDNECEKTVDCDTDQCNVNCQGAFPEWQSCTYRACNKHTGIQEPNQRELTRHYKVSRKLENSGNPCPEADGKEEKKTCEDIKCRVDCEGYWSSCPTVGYSQRKYKRTVNPLNGGSSCPVDGEIGNCPSTPTLSNKGLSIKDHCMQTKGYWNDYWGDPSNGWPLIMWWHDPSNGKKCFNESRFRVNFLSDGRIQSVKNNNLYLVQSYNTPYDEVKWKANGNDKWFVNNEGKIQHYDVNDLIYDRYTSCMGHINVHNNAGIHLRGCDLAPKIDIVD